jgi:protein required for attachment to host cells
MQTPGSQKIPAASAVVVTVANNLVTFSGHLRYASSTGNELARRNEDAAVEPASPATSSTGYQANGSKLTAEHFLPNNLRRDPTRLEYTREFDALGRRKALAMVKHPLTWILIADGSRARLFVAEPRATSLKPAFQHEFIGTNLPSREIGSDQPGRAFDSAGAGRHAMEPPTDPHRYEKMSFARDVANILDDARKRREFSRLVVVAPPQALGDLRSAFSDPLRKLVVAELAKDLTKIPVHELSSHLAEIEGI